MTGISRDEWLKALGEADAPNDPDALTTAEIGALLGLGQTAMLRRLRALLKEKRAVRTVKVIQDAAGRRQRVCAYRLVKGKKK